MPRTPESRWFQAPSRLLTAAAAAAAAAVTASQCQVWISRRVSRGSEDTCHHVPGDSTRGGGRRGELMLQQQQQPSIAAGRLAFLMQPRSVTPLGNRAASLKVSRNQAAAVAVRGVSYDPPGVSSKTSPRRPRRRHHGWSWTLSEADPSTKGWFSTSRVSVVDGGCGGGTDRSCTGRETVDFCALAAAGRVPRQRGAGSLPPPPPPLSRPLRTLPLKMRAEVEEEGVVVVGQEEEMVVVMQEGGVRVGGEEEADGRVKPERSLGKGEGMKRARVQSSARRQEAVGGLVLRGAGEAGAGTAGTEWCTRAAEARACEEEPLLAEAFRQFEEKHPGATIIYLAHSGSRLYGTNTPESDVDIKGVFIPASPPAPHATNQRRSSGGKKEGSGSAGNSTARRPRTPAAPHDEEFPAEETFWYSTSNSTAPNTVEDIDVELVSLDRFLAQLMRGDISGLETLFSMLVPKVCVLADPEIIPLIVQERRWMVSRNVSCWTGFAHSHVARFRKVQQKSLNVARKARFKEQQRLKALGKKDASVSGLTSSLASTLTPESSSSPASTPTLSWASTSSSTETSTDTSDSTSSETSKPILTSTSTSTEALTPSLIAASTATTPSSSTSSSNPISSSTSSPTSASSGAEASRPVSVAGSAGNEEQVMIRRADGEKKASAAVVTVAGRSNLGVAAGVVAAETETTGSSAVLGESGSASPGSRLGVLSRGGVKVGLEGGRREEVGEGEEKGLEDEEGEEERREKELARKIKCGKLLAHARRSIMQAEELLSTGKITFPLRPLQVDELRRLKALKVHVPKKVANIQAGARRLLVKGNNSPLPSAPNRGKLIALRKEALDTLDRRRRRESEGL